MCHTRVTPNLNEIVLCQKLKNYFGWKIERFKNFDSSEIETLGRRFERRRQDWEERSAWKNWDSRQRTQEEDRNGNERDQVDY